MEKWSPLEMVEKFFVQPAASDDGVALGAALAPYLDEMGRCRIANASRLLGNRRSMMKPSKSTDYVQNPSREIE